MVFPFVFLPLPFLHEFSCLMNLNDGLHVQLWRLKHVDTLQFLTQARENFLSHPPNPGLVVCRPYD